jgi:hypothetical protein
MKTGLLLIAAATVALSACGAANFLGSSSSGGLSLSEAVPLASGAINLAGAVAGARSGGGLGGGYADRPAAGLANTNGYSQLGSFQDCQKMYNAAGMYDLARQCAQRATDMSSLGGQKILH